MDIQYTDSTILWNFFIKKILFPGFLKILAHVQTACVLGSPFPPQKRAWIRGYMYTVYSTTYGLRMYVDCKDAGVLLNSCNY
jgi:hypothetical protein